MGAPRRADIRKRVDALIQGGAISRRALEEMTFDIARLSYEAGRCSARRSEVAPPQSAIADIQQRVAAHYQVPAGDMTASSLAWRRGLRPRQIAMYIVSKTEPESLTSIGRKFGNRDRTTVAHAITTIQAMCDRDPLFRAEVEDLSRGPLLRQAA